MGIEPTYAAWEARLNPARSISYLQNFVIPVPMGSSGYEWSAKLFAQPTNVRLRQKRTSSALTPRLPHPGWQAPFAAHFQRLSDARDHP